MSKKVIENIKKYKLAEKYLEKAKRRDNSYKFLVTGIDIKQLQKEKENPSLYQGRSRAFNYRPKRIHHDESYFEWLHELQMNDYDSFIEEYNKLTDGQQTEYDAWLLW